MKIKNISIKNYGCLTNFELNPSDGLNVMYAPNESGKTTLLSFIKFAFYSSKEKKIPHVISFKEKYTPWNGEKAVGCVDFVSDKIEYTLTRCEGKTSADSYLSLVKTNTGERCSITSTPGFCFFGFDEKTFSDTCFVGNNLSIANGNSENEIVNIISGEENNSYLSAKKTLEEEIASLSSSRRAKSKLSVCDAKIKECEEKTLDLKCRIKELSSSLANKSVIEEEILNIENEISEIEMRELNKEKENYECKLNTLKEKSENILKYENEICVTDKNINDSNITSFCNLFCKTTIVISALLFVLFTVLCFMGKLSTAFPAISIALLAGMTVFYTQKRKTVISSKKQLSDKNDVYKLQIDTLKENMEFYENCIGRIDKSIHNIMDGGYKGNKTEINTFTNEIINDIITSKLKRKDELTKKLLSLSTVENDEIKLKENLCILESEMDSLIVERNKLMSKIGIYKCALTILEDSFAKIKNVFAPKISRKAYEIFSQVAGEKYDGIFTNEKFESGVKIKNEYRSADFLSTGAKELVYLSLRLAVVEELSGGCLPVFFDDSFVTFDDDRNKAILKFVYKLSKNHQIFLCTCRRNDVDYLSKMDGVKIISM